MKREHIRPLFLFTIKAPICLIIWLGLLVQATAASIEPQQRCATTPTYQYFEDIQYDAYKLNPPFYKMLGELRNNQKALKQLSAVTKELQKRPNILGRPDDDKAGMDFLQSTFKNLHLPTCYENPLTFIMLTWYAKQLDNARLALNFEPSAPINLATLPTSDVNAYTYPAYGGLDNILAFNVELFMFDYQMTKSLISTIDIGKERVDFSPKTTFRKLLESSDIATDFSMALLEFIGLVPPSTRPIDKSYDKLLIRFTMGMELFAVAHEYGHVIRQHKSPSKKMALGVNDDGNSKGETRDVEVLARSWQQELEADQIGIKLAMQALRSEAQSEDLKLTWLYSVKAALFFFRCQELVDQAKAVKNGEKIRSPNFSERAFVRAFADGKSSPADNDKYKDLTVSDHPPPWLRLERVQATIEATIAEAPPSRESETFSDVAEGIISNAPLVWNYISPKFAILAEAIISQKKSGKSLADLDPKQLKAKTDQSKLPKLAIPFPPGCYVRIADWLSTFLCNPALQGALVAFQAGTADDNHYVGLYHAAIERDWILLGGTQVSWSRAVLERNIVEFRRDALALLALSGDRASNNFLEKLDTTSWSDSDRQLLSRTTAFLIEHGRDVSFSKLAAAEPANFLAVDFLDVPELSSSTLTQLIPQWAPYGTEQFLAEHSGVSSDGPVSGLMLALLFKHWPAGKVDSELADLLEASGSKDAAMKFAVQGLTDGGPKDALENSVGNLLTAKHEFEQANTHYAASLDAGRSDGWPELNIANNLMRLDRNDQAELMYRKALSRRASARNETEFAKYLNDTAWFLATKRSAEPAKLKEALALSYESNSIVKNKVPNYLDTLAECQLRLGDPAGAVKTGEQVMQLVASADIEQRKKFADRLDYFKKALAAGDGTDVKAK